MSRRCHHGSPRRGTRPVARERHRAPGPADRSTPQPPVADEVVLPESDREAGTQASAADAGPRAEVVEQALLANRASLEPSGPDPLERPREAAPKGVGPRVQAARGPSPDAGGPGGMLGGTTAPQLRRFIKSRAYVPMHELRRRFVINGNDDEVTSLQVEQQVVYVGLPEREGRLLGELVRGGDIGVELSLDPIAPIVVGVYPMRPVPRT